MENALRTSPDARRLIELRDYLSSRASARGATPAGIRAAFNARDTAAMLQLTGLTDEEAREFGRQLQQVVARLYDEYPQLRLMNAGRSTPSVCANSLSVVLAGPGGNSGITRVTLGGLSNQTEDGAKCQYVQYIAALALCTAGGPLWYWPCAYLAMCAYCNNVPSLCQ